MALISMLSRLPSAAAAAEPGAAGWQRAALAGAILIAVVLPFVVQNFVIFQLTMAVDYAIAILGLNLLTGINGQFSLGHSTFFAIGAYVSAILMNEADLSFYWTLPVAGLVCFGFGFLFGLPALRLGPVYLALATFALAFATPQLLRSTPLKPWTGGVEGISVIRPDTPLGLPLTGDQWLYFVSLAVALVMVAGAVNLIDSRTGRAMIAIRDNPIAARAMGIDLALYKTTTFGVSALYAGVAGALSTAAVQYVAPDSFTIVLAIGLFVGLVIGGVGSVAGTVFGGLFLVFVPNIAEGVSKGLANAVYGVILLLVIYLMPAGAGGLMRLLAAKIEAARRS
jgi:branched-chain amino acid transport system permease protein